MTLVTYGLTVSRVFYRLIRVWGSAFWAKKKHCIADFFNYEQSQEQKFDIILPFSGFGRLIN
jgi:hypothetical protein